MSTPRNRLVVPTVVATGVLPGSEGQWRIVVVWRDRERTWIVSYEVNDGAVDAMDQPKWRDADDEQRRAIIGCLVVSRLVTDAMRATLATREPR